MKQMKAIPDRWLEYNACGRVIEGTRLICFKVPLRKEVQVKEPSITQIWDIPAVLAEIPRLSAVIDLTNTARYYNPKDFLAAKVLHKKILMPGRVIPPESKVKEFIDAVDEFLGRDCDSLVGVHCTHGLNRTGYMVCRYMRDRLGIAGPEAIKRFETARGYKIERDVYINGILKAIAVPEHEGKEPNNSRNEINQFENSHNKVFIEAPDVDDHLNEYNHHRGRWFNNIPPRNRRFEPNRDRRSNHNDETYGSQPSFANRGAMRSNYDQGPSRSFHNHNRQYKDISRNNDDRYDRRSNYRFTPYHKRGSNNFRGNYQRNNNHRYDGGTSSNYARNSYNQFEKSRENCWRKRENESSDNKSTRENSGPDRS